MKKNETFKPTSNHTEVLYLQEWMDQYPWLVAGFSTRLGGRSQQPYESLNCGLHVGDNPLDVAHNRERLTKLHDFPFIQWTSANQVHGTNIHCVTAGDSGKGRESLDSAIPDADGLYTSQKNIFLASFYADCVPLFFIDPVQRMVGIAHAGWKGTVSQIGSKFIQHWQNEHGSDLSDIQVAIGPAIGDCCYEVDDFVMDHVKPFAGNLSTECFTPNDTGKYQLNLKQINYNFLKQAGIPEENIEVSSWCTSCRTDLFFSHRKEKGKTGRMTAFMAIKEEEM
jgi:YfiH family protein